MAGVLIRELLKSRTIKKTGNPLNDFIVSVFTYLWSVHIQVDMRSVAGWVAFDRMTQKLLRRLDMFQKKIHLFRPGSS